MKPFKNYAAFAALGALMLASLSASAKPDQESGNSKQNSDTETSATVTTIPTDANTVPKSKLNEWDRYRMTAGRDIRSSRGSRGTVGEALAHKALSYRGVHYRMGGTTTNGIDCSGLTQAVYKKWGMLIPRTSTEQFQKGKSVPRAQLKPGDLVFFANTYKRGISHVGIFVGDNKFVHASGSGRGVIVSSLGDAYHANHFAGARRIALDKQRQPVDSGVTAE